MIVFKTIQFARLQAINNSAKDEKRTNLKKLPRRHKLPQGTPTESVKGGVKISKTCLPPIDPLCLSKVLEKGWPPQRHRLHTIGKEVGPQQVEKESPNYTDAFLCSPLWEEHVIRHQVEVGDGLSSVLPPQHVNAQLDTQHIIQTNDAPSKLRPVMQ